MSSPSDVDTKDRAAPSASRIAGRARRASLAGALVLGAGAVAWAGSHRARPRSNELPSPKAPPAPMEAAHPDEAPTAAPRAVPSTLHVPRLATPLLINAETDGKTAWEGEIGNTENLRDEAGNGMVPYTEAKVRWGDGKLYFLLYAGDLDLEGKVKKPDSPLDRDDAFRLEFAGRAPEGRAAQSMVSETVRLIDVSVLGTVSDARCTGPRETRRCDARWQSHAKVAVDRDGTLNRIGDNDEEWVVEMAVPLSALGLSRAGPGTRIPFSVSRCEIGYDGPHACGSWGKRSPAGELILDP